MASPFTPVPSRAVLDKRLSNPALRVLSAMYALADFADEQMVDLVCDERALYHAMHNIGMTAQIFSRAILKLMALRYIKPHRPHDGSFGFLLLEPPDGDEEPRQ